MSKKSKYGKEPNVIGGIILSLLGTCWGGLNYLRKTRRSFSFVGPNGAGKTTLYKMLKAGPDYYKEKSPFFGDNSKYTEPTELYVSQKDNNFFRYEFSFVIDCSGDKVAIQNANAKDALYVNYDEKKKNKLVDYFCFVFDAARYVSNEEYKRQTQALMQLYYSNLMNICYPDKNNPKEQVVKPPKFIVWGTHSEDSSSLREKILDSVKGKPYSPLFNDFGFYIGDLRYYTPTVESSIKEMIKKIYEEK